MKLLLDQNICKEPLEFIRGLKIDAISTREIQLERADNKEILAVAKELDRIIITFNFDFSDIRSLQPGTNPGIIFLRIEPQTMEIVHPILKHLFSTIKWSELKNALTVVTNSKIRVRKA